MFLFSYPRESAHVNWDIEKVSLSDEGFYECVAISSAGTGRAQTFFDVSGNYHPLCCYYQSINAAMEMENLLILTSPHMSCVTLGQLLRDSVPWIP